MAASAAAAPAGGAGGARGPPPPLPSFDARAADEVLAFWFGGGDEQQQPEDRPWLRAVRDPLAWPSEASKRWFFGGQAVDDAVRRRFSPLLDALAADPARARREWLEADLAEAQGAGGGGGAAAAAGAAAATTTTPLLPLRALAGIVAMDQMSRNAFRGAPRAFGLDGEALSWSRRLVSNGLHRRLAPAARQFVLLPFEHAEDMDAQRESVELFRQMLEDAEAEVAAAAAAARGGDDATVAAAKHVASMCSATLEYAQKHLAVVERWGRFPGRNAALGRETTAEEKAAMESGEIPKW